MKTFKEFMNEQSEMNEEDNDVHYLVGFEKKGTGAMAKEVYNNGEEFNYTQAVDKMMKLNNDSSQKYYYFIQQKGKDLASSTNHYNVTTKQKLKDLGVKVR